MDDAPTLISRALRKSTVSVTELRCDARNFGRTNPIPREDAYLIALQLRGCPDHDLYFDGRLTRPTNFRAGVTAIYDLRTDPVADLRDPFHSLMFHLPRKALDAVADEAGRGRIGDLRHKPGVGFDDLVVRHLLAALLPATARSEEAHPLFLDHTALALAVHMAHQYGGLRASQNSGGLAPWQERRAKEMMSEGLREDVPLARLAAECGLSVRHFARAFRHSTGIPPHRWLLRFRVERATELLRRSSLSLAEIALACGFADQSHFTRVFTGVIGMGPGTWRRANGRNALD
ncbi:MAG TPA: AraC family transcriptional regulator [Bryobacteraceae bacterium]|nr:AraC family transcriptional regulator [Bryobacteraceae bacterium]